jgi:signal transduction histidine kinase
MLCPNKLHRLKSDRYISALRGYCPLFYVLLYVIIRSDPSAAQTIDIKESNYIINHYTTENGLPQNSIKGLAFDALGYCWIGTENGLVKYDGIRFRLYEDYQDPPLSARVTFVKQGANKQILIGFEGGELYRIRQVDYFGTIPVADSGQYLWGNGRGFMHANDPFTRSLHNLITARAKRTTDDYFLTGNDALYIKTVDSLIIAAAGLPTLRIPWKSLQLSAATVIEGKFIGITQHHTARIIDLNGQVSSEVRLQGEFFDDIDLDKGNYSLIMTDSLTYGFCQGKLYKLAFRENAITSFPVITGLGNISVSDIYYDASSETYYLQSRTDGLILAKIRHFQNVQIPGADWKQNSFYGQNLYQKDQILANGHLFSFPNESGNPMIRKVISVGNQLSSFIEGDDYYYESDFKLFKFNLKSGKLKEIAALDDLAHCFLRSPYDGKVYFSTTDKLFALKNDIPRHAVSLPSNLKGYIYSFVFVRKDSVLIATSRGLWSANLTNGTTRQVVKDINVRSIYQGKDGHTWLATYNQGCFLQKAGRFLQIPMDPGNRLAVVNSILEDRKGRIWFSTNNGLLCTSRQTLLDHLSGIGHGVTYQIYDKSDGLVTNEFNGSATPDKVFLSDGRVSLPSLKSLVLFNPDTFPVDSSGTKLFLDEVKIDGIRTTSLSNLELPAGVRSMVISVSTPWTNKAESLYFERKIAGYDSDWIPFPATDKIELRGLTYGNYLLNIRVKGKPGSHMQLKFRVAPYFYQTNWFKLALTMAAALIIFMIFRYSIRHYTNENLLLDRRIKERTHELNESLENLNTTVSQLQRAESQLQINVQQKENIINMLLHDMKSPLIALKNGIEELDYKLGIHDSVTEDILRKSRLLREGISDVYSFSVNFFDWVKYQKEGITANYQITNLNEVFTTIGELYGGIARQKGIDLQIAPCDITFYTDENILVTMLRNLVDNAIKNTRSGSVRLSVETHMDNLTITIQDTGPGMEPDMLEIFNEAFLGVTTLDGQVGYGYRLIAHLTTLIHADIELENNDGLQVNIYLNLITKPEGF